jgi:two-component system, NtrC family, response regulator AtoC
MPLADSNDKGLLLTPNSLPPNGIIFGRSAAMAAVRQTLAKIAGANVSVVLTGEGGTGKELLARWTHVHSPYGNGEFVKVNCAAIPNPLLESELFGYERGAFTGAISSKPGRFELANNGTLFLDEIADLDLSLQSKLLHFLQDGTFSRIGENAERRVDTRLICATNKELEEGIKTNRFRADLFYRINVVQLRLPSLRDRREDIPELAEYLRTRCEKQFEKVTKPFRPEMMEYLQNRNWPGNLRELSNEIARYVLIGADGSLEEDRPHMRKSAKVTNHSGKGSVSLKRIAKDAVRDMERNIILQALRANQWNRRRTAQALKISYRALMYKISEAGLSSKSSAANGITAAMKSSSEEKEELPRRLPKNERSAT